MTRIDGFREAVESHYENRPEAMTVRRMGDHVYGVFLGSGHGWQSRRTRAEAEAETAPDGAYPRAWRELERWYSGKRVPRERDLTDDERRVIAEVRAAYGVEADR